MMAGPVILLYELGIIGAKVFGKKKQSSDEAEDEDKDSEG
jgi:Sec-independent protein secretion pathway component TatC